jgi:hypothetical protein
MTVLFMDISFKQDVMQRIHTIEIKKILIIQESVQGLNLMMIKTDILHYKIIFILYLNMEKMDLIKMPRSIFQQV